MRIETMLPLGKVDPGLRAPATALDIATVFDDAREVEALGFDGLVVEETKEDPFQVLALAAQATRSLRLGTSVAIAFPRSPYVTAMSAWTLQRLSRGRFTLGLGTQVRGHIVRRFGMAWSPPAPWLREYILAVRALWQNWQLGTPLDVQGRHYRIDLVVPLFVPAPIDWPRIPIHVAAVKPGLCRVAGEVADGLRTHPVCTADYIRSVMLPAVEIGAARGERDTATFAIAHKPLVATAPDAVTLQARVEDARARIAFYLSTPAYRPAFAHHGHEAQAERAAALSKAGQWEALPALVDDELLHTYVTVATWDDIGDRLRARFGAVVSQLEFSIAPRTPAERGFMTRLIESLR